MKTRNISDMAVPKRHPELKGEITEIIEDCARKTCYILTNGCRYIEDDLEPQEALGLQQGIKSSFKP